MRKLSIDIEAYSGADLLKCGVYKYTEHEDFEVLLFAYAYDDEPVRVVDLAQGDEIPRQVLRDMKDPDVLKTAFNANFELTCLRKYLGLHLPAEQWECTMVRAGMAGLPMRLSEVAKAMKLEQQKMTEGKALIRYFSMPCKPTKTNGGRTRNLPEHSPEKWETFKKYCGQDVETERDVYRNLYFVQWSAFEHDLWVLDQKINDTGIRLDWRLAEQAIEIDADNKENLTAVAEKLTGLANPNSVSQLSAWLNDMLPDDSEEVTSVSKATLQALLDSGNTSAVVTQMIKLRQELSKTSTKKYVTMLNALRKDGRVGGLLQFYGASRTGRWAGRLIQVQNLPRNMIPDLDEARELVLDGDMETLRMCFGNVPRVLSELIRTAFIADEGKTFLVADYSAIEARVIAWLADEQWVLDVFNTHGKIYEATAAQMFNVPIESVTKKSGLRDRGKVAQLACGYQGGVAALTAMDVGNKIPEEEKPGLVQNWREANPNIVKLWGIYERAAIKAVKEKTSVTVKHNVTFSYMDGFMFITLPSGRKLSYPNVRLEENRFGKMAIKFEGQIQKTGQWGHIDTYGGKLTENIVQAVARDCLAYALINLDEAGYRICMHIHDEVVIEDHEENLEDVCRIMGQPIPWAEGLPLRADGYATRYYKKD